MTLKTLIIRAEGALVETEDVRRAAFARVFGEAGFAWNHARDAFAKSAAFGSSATRMAHYVRESLKGRPETSELRHLITAMQRRHSDAGRFQPQLSSGTSGTAVMRREADPRSTDPMVSGPNILPLPVAAPGRSAVALPAHVLPHATQSVGAS